MILYVARFWHLSVPVTGWTAVIHLGIVIFKTLCLSVESAGRIEHNTPITVAPQFFMYVFLSLCLCNVCNNSSPQLVRRYQRFVHLLQNCPLIFYCLVFYQLYCHYASFALNFICHLLADCTTIEVRCHP